MKLDRVAVCAALTWSIAWIIAAPAGARAAEPVSFGTEIALARLREIRTLVAPIQTLGWPDFEPPSVPAIFYEPGDWAVAVGFEQPPPGFHLVEGVKDVDRPVYEAGPGTFHHEGRSPALVAGRWTVLSRFEQPEPLPSGARMGRRNAEEALAAFVGDAFMIHLMKQRKASTPFPTGTAAYPESPELMALTSMEQEALVAPLQFRQVTERNIEEYRTKVRQAIAIRHARWKLMGPELAALEDEIERTEGLGLYGATLGIRQAVNQAVKPSDIGKTDGTFKEYAHAFQSRVFMINYPMSFTVDNPAFTLPQVAQRGCALATLLDREDVKWHPDGLAGDKPLIDALAAKQDLKPDDEPALLEAAKADFRYDALVRLAQADLTRLRRDREAELARLFPAGSDRLEIRLKGDRVATYIDDPMTTGHLGEGRLTHPGGLGVKGPGFDLSAAPVPDAGPPRVLTQAGARRDALKSVLVRLPAGAELTLGGKRLRIGRSVTSLTTEKPLRLNAPGLDLILTAGTVSAGPDGSVQVEMSK